MDDILFLYGSFVYNRVIVLGDVEDNLLDLFHCWLFHDCVCRICVLNMRTVSSLSICGIRMDDGLKEEDELFGKTPRPLRKNDIPCRLERQDIRVTIRQCRYKVSDIHYSVSCAKLCEQARCQRKWLSKRYRYLSITTRAGPTR